MPYHYFAYYGYGSVWIVLILVFFLVRPKRRTKLDRFIFWVGNASIVYIIFMAIWSQFHRAKNGDNYILLGALPYVILMLMAGTRYYGENNKISNFGSQAFQLFGRVFLFLFLPVAILTGILLLLSYMFHWGQ